jgi:hypothetical protein
MIFKPKAGKPGQELTWRWLNGLRAWCQENDIKPGVNSGISVIKSQLTGTQLRVDFPPGAFVGIVQSPGITARSGLTMGSGPVEIYSKNQSTGAYVDTGVQITVDSVSSVTGGIPSGCWVTCAYQDDGTPTLLNVDYGA